jgi:hypothetical protein
MSAIAHGTAGSSNGSSSDSSSMNGIIKLRKRLLSLPRSKWTLHNSFEVIAIATAGDLATLDSLSECWAKVAEHVQSLASTEQQQQLLVGLNR